MKFGKHFHLYQFEELLTEEFQKTGEIARKRGCCRKTATNMLNLLLETKELESKVYNTPIDVEMAWARGGAKGTRAWRRIPKEKIVSAEKKNGKIKALFDKYAKTCKHRGLHMIENTYNCVSNENKSWDCNAKVCPMIIRR